MTKAKPVVDRSKAAELNLQVLKRLDPDTEEVLASAGHVSVYEFDESKHAWARKGIEGSLFVVKRRVQPRFQMFILNKKSAENYLEDLDDSFKFELQKPYIIYRNKQEEVVGLWFYDQMEGDKMAALLTRITATFPSSRARPPPDAACVVGSATGNGAGEDDSFFGWKAAVTGPPPSEGGTGAMALPTAAPPVADALLPASAPVMRNNSIHQLLLNAQQPLAVQPPQPAMPVGAGLRLSDLPGEGGPSLSGQVPVSAAPQQQWTLQQTPAGAAPPRSMAAPLPPVLLNPLLLAAASPQVTSAPTTAPPPAMGTQLPAALPTNTNFLQRLLSSQAPSAHSAPLPSAPQTESAPEEQLHGRVQQLLHSLADNAQFVAIVATELRKCGFH